MGFVIFMHCVVSVLLMTVILMQAGRGGGLTEQFASAENIFGARTNTFMVKATAVIASFFMITCMLLAFLSSKQEQSLMSKRAAATAPQPIGTPVPKAPESAAKTENPTSEKPQAAEAEKTQETQSAPPGGESSQPVNPADAQKPQ